MEAPPFDFIQARDHVSRQGQNIQLIVLHATAGTNSLKWLLGNVRGTSIHILIDKKGNTKRLVRDDRGANHAGYSEVTLNGKHFGRARGVFNVNVVSLGIELENENNGKDPYPDAQLEMAARWIVYWRSLYGNIPVLMHREIDTQGKTDPIKITHERLQSYINRVMGVKEPAPVEDDSYTSFDPPLVGILTDDANVRQGPSRTLGIATVYPKDTRVLIQGIKRGEMIGNNNRWCHLANELGFIHNSIVKLKENCEEVADDV